MQTSQLIGGRYEQLEFVAQGAMGIVYRGRDTQTDDLVAIKVLKHDFLSRHPELANRFIREGEALRLLNHPNIVKLLATAAENGRRYLILEYVSGGSLSDVLRQHPQLAIERVLRIGIELADALVRAHHLKILHRDIKPANILLAEDDTPRLTDFGVARVGPSDITHAGQIVGTIAYMPPEAFTTTPLDERADLWSLGVVLFEMLTGQRPFAGEDMTGLMAALATTTLPDLEALRPDAPIALVDLIYRMLAKDRNQRISSARQVGSELETIINELESPTQTARRLPLSASSSFLATPISSGQPLHNLPIQSTLFVGREHELGSLSALIANADLRHITILGPGGMGKTRLALEAARLERERYQDGVYFVSLAPLDSPDFIVSAIAAALSFQFSSGGAGQREPKQQLLDYLRGKSFFLVLDNFEHLLAGSELVGEILQVAPTTKILVTSRERLNLRGETLFPLEGMDFPSWTQPEDALEYGAAKLFMQSARLIRPAFTVDAENLSDLARICAQVQGMPLAIVLAAAWIDTLSLREISEEIARNLDFLQTEQRDMPLRQRSIRAVFDHSWELLSADVQDVFKKLSVFQGGFTREAAQAVSGASLRTLSTLINKSILRRSPDGRYIIHELLRQYAAQHLSESPLALNAAQEAHTRYFVAFMTRQEPLLYAGQQHEAMKAIATDFDNVRMAWDHVTANYDAVAFRSMAWCLWRYLFLQRANDDMEVMFKLAVERLPSGDTQCSINLGLALAGLACAYNPEIYPDKSEKAIQQSLSILRQYVCPRETALVLGLAAFTAPTIDESIAYLQESLALFYKAEDEGNAAYFAGNLADFLQRKGDHRQANEYLRQAMTAAELLGNPFVIQHVRYRMGMNVFFQGNFEQALDHFNQCLALTQQEGAYHEMALALRNLGWVARRQGNYAEAERFYRQGLDLVRQLGNQQWISWFMSALGLLAYWQGRHDEAIQTLLNVLNLIRQSGAHKADVANALNNLGHPTAALGHYADAESQFREALRLSIDVGERRGTIEAAIGLANLFSKAGQPEAGVELLAATLADPAITTELQEMADPVLDELQGQLATEAFKAAQENGSVLNLEKVAVDLLGLPPLFTEMQARELALQRRELAHERQRRETMERVDRSKDEERARIAREMHDGLAQTLAGLRFRVRTWPRLLSSDPASLDAELNEVGPILDETIQELRRVIFALRPVQLEEMGLILSVRQLAESVSKHYPILVHTDIQGDEGALPSSLEHSTFRIVQEALHNAMRHAEADNIWIKLNIGTRQIELEIRDDGVGFDLALLDSRAQQGHFGLLNLRERAAALKGALTIDSVPGQGTVVRAALPIDRAGERS